MVLILIIVIITPGCINPDNKNDEESLPPTYDVIDKEMNEYVSSSNEFTFKQKNSTII